MNRENSTRFLDAFAHIEQALEDILGTTRHKPFYQLVDEAARKDPFVQDIAVELKEYGDLRNAIVHERIDDEPIAEPHAKTVARIERIRDLLLEPPKVDQEFLGPVITCQTTDLVSTAAELMYQHSFSKIPVYDEENRFVGLLTAEAITHWLGAQLQKRSNDLYRERVESVLKYVDERTTSFRFISRHTPVFEVMRLFDETTHRGQRLQAVIITHDGREDAQPLGIITVFDLPKIFNLIN